MRLLPRPVRRLFRWFGNLFLRIRLLIVERARGLYYGISGLWERFILGTARVWLAFKEWFTTRHWIRLVYGLPALLVITACAFLTSLCLLTTADATTVQYRTAAASAMSHQEFTVAKLYLERLARLGVNDNATLFDLARASEKVGDIPRMVGVMEELSPAEYPRYAPAHLWQAARLLTATATPEAIELGERHLRSALALAPSDATAHGMLGELYLQQGRTAAAITHLSQAMIALPSLKLSLAKAYSLQGDRSRALRLARDAQTHYSNLVRQNSHDHAARTRWADSTMFLEQFETAAAILQEGLEIANDRRFRFGLCRVMIAWSDSLRGETRQERVRQFELLAAGLAANPDEPLLFDRLMRLLKTRDRTSTALHDALRQNIADGHAVGLSHLLLGTMAASEKDRRSAQFHLERALSLVPSGPVVANNLAWTLAMQDPPELDRALPLIDAVLKQAPDDARFLDTRGQIYAKLERWREAISDLERALPRLRDNRQTHAALARAYAAIGERELSDAHRQWLESIRSDSPWVE